MLLDKGATAKDRKALLWKYVLEHPRHFLVDGIVRNVTHFAAPPRDWWIARGDVRPGLAQRRTPLQP